MFNDVNQILILRRLLIMKMFTKAIALAFLAVGSTSVVFADTQTNATQTTAMQQTATVNDATITQNVQAAIAAKKMLADQKIDVSTNQGVVTLSGDLKTKGQAFVAVMAAQSVTGVQDVDTSKLVVKKESKHPLDDAFITAKVKGMFLREKLLGNNAGMSVMNIHVDTRNGIVYLTGDADSQDQLSKAIALAKSVKNVKKVDSTVSVKKA